MPKIFWVSFFLSQLIILCEFENQEPFCSTKVKGECRPLSFENVRNFVQYGEPRSASTYQFELMCIAVRIKFGGSNVSCGYMSFEKSQQYHVIKTHSKKNMPRPDILFASIRSQKFPKMMDREKQISYLQYFEDLLVVGESGLNHYIQLFQLDKKQARTLHEYMHYWQVIRKCCAGLQSSGSWYHELKNDTQTYYTDVPFLYNDCGMYDLAEVERRLLNTTYCQDPDNQCAFGRRCVTTVQSISVLGKGKPSKEALHQANMAFKNAERLPSKRAPNKSYLKSTVVGNLIEELQQQKPKPKSVTPKSTPRQLTRLSSSSEGSSSSSPKNKIQQSTFSRLTTSSSSSSSSSTEKT